MSSLHSDRGRLVVTFRLRGRKGPQVHLYPGLRYTRENCRAPLVKELQVLIAGHRWAELAERFPKCRHLDQFRVARQLADPTTFRAVSERYLEYQRAERSQATVAFYRNILRPHVWSTPFADKPLRLIDTADIAALWAPLRSRGHFSQARNVRRVVSAVFNWAQGLKDADGNYLVADNPVDRIQAIPVDEDEDSIDPFRVDEQARLVAACHEGWERRLVVVALETGLRPAENFGLKRTDIDVRKRLVQVRQTWSRFREGKPKNQRSRRAVNLSEEACRALSDQLTEVRSCVTPWLWQVLPMTKVQPRNPQNFSRRQWPMILQRAGVGHRNFYQCRHTFATNLLERGEPERYIADQMGHKDVTMLREVYWRWKRGTLTGRREKF